jgi:membrane protease YdiL (CAAX protease family)
MTVFWVERDRRLGRIEGTVREFGKILGYFAAVLCVGALLAPPLYWAGQAWVATGSAGFLAKYGFQKYFNRAVLMAALGLLWPWARWVGWGGLGQRGAEGMGAGGGRAEKAEREGWMEPDGRAFERVGWGFGLGALGLGVLAAGYVVAGVCVLKPEIPWAAFGKAMVSAWVVAGLEEVLFRGALHSVFRRSLRQGWALAVTSGLFAIVHFLKPNPAFHLEAVGWSAGFRLIPELFHQFQDFGMVLGGGMTLWVLGWVLGWAVHRTGSLWMSIGLHAGLVWVKLGFEKWAVWKGGSLPWVGSQLQIGLAPLFVLVALGVLVEWKTRTTAGPSASGSRSSKKGVGA